MNDFWSTSYPYFWICHTAFFVLVFSFLFFSFLSGKGGFFFSLSFFFFFFNFDIYTEELQVNVSRKLLSECVRLVFVYLFWVFVYVVVMYLWTLLDIEEEEEVILWQQAVISISKWYVKVFIKSVALKIHWKYFGLSIFFDQYDHQNTNNGFYLLNMPNHRPQNYHTLTRFQLWAEE